MSDPVIVSIGSNKPLELPVVLTDAAAAKVAEARDAEGHAMPLRVEVRPGGCSGFRTKLFFDEAQIPSDIIASFEVAGTSTVHLVIDPDSLKALQAGKPRPEVVTIDYTESLQGSGFQFDNPNATRTCGCGDSFS
jgi:iron-sulfur cluster assembly accessory protein